MHDRSVRRVVVTGLGLVTPLGTGVDKTWKALCAGESGVSRITRFDPSGYDAQIAAEVKDFDPAQFIEIQSKKIHHNLVETVLPAQSADEEGSFNGYRQKKKGKVLFSGNAKDSY
jgi:3-oxoacyl-(acyl-carrier-protein) synthase